ncbi:C40 family peptidase [Streptomyces sp. MBT65]|uniref:C40 family peptidase n=1 Tax=Streptomyces sp. MBT65 TaxID=1488395 RepID=UPI00190B2133|nr:C40 family peptidase [Streptomyces sp. MBT65]MBK3578528.1 C40 family peptidase [Streptomyces sp. MBT65]
MASSHRKPRSTGSRIAGIWTPADDGGNQSLGEVEQKIDDLYRRADSATERRGSAKRTQKINSVREQPSSFAATPHDHYDQAQLMSRLTARRRNATDAHLTERSTTTRKPQEATESLRTTDETRSDLGTAKATVQRKLSTARALLSQLAARERRNEAAALAGQAIAFARAQVGKPYVWGAAGPGSYDSSGLAQAAWKAAGVTLPRIITDQIDAGTTVPLADAQPGDLVFFHFHDEVSHVGVYVGDGMMIHAPKPGTYVREESIHYDGTATVHGVVRPA